MVICATLGNGMTMAGSAGVSRAALWMLRQQHNAPVRARQPARSAAGRPACPRAAQIRIWERQTQRVRATESILYDNFELPKLYELSLQYCTKVGTGSTS